MRTYITSNEIFMHSTIVPSIAATNSFFLSDKTNPELAKYAVPSGNYTYIVEMPGFKFSPEWVKKYTNMDIRQRKRFSGHTEENKGLHTTILPPDICGKIECVPFPDSPYMAYCDEKYSAILLPGIDNTHATIMRTSLLDATLLIATGKLPLLGELVDLSL